jgi:hypothetical protein
MEPICVSVEKTAAARRTAASEIAKVPRKRDGLTRARRSATLG